MEIIGGSTCLPDTIVSSKTATEYLEMQSRKCVKVSGCQPHVLVVFTKQAMLSYFVGPWFDAENPKKDALAQAMKEIGHQENVLGLAIVSEAFMMMSGKSERIEVVMINTFWRDLKTDCRVMRKNGNNLERICELEGIRSESRFDPYAEDRKVSGLN